MLRLIRTIAVGVALGRAAALCIGALPAFANWIGPSDPVLHAWFDQLASGKGLCCSFADGVSISDVDWDTHGPNNGYRVRLNGQWINVPPKAVVTVPNKFGQAVVWPFQEPDYDSNGNVTGSTTQIRCFMPGAGA
jgi:hypothetical protein